MVTLSTGSLDNPPATRLFIGNVGGDTTFVRIYRSSALEPEFVLAETTNNIYNDYTAVNGIIQTYRAVEVTGSLEGSQASKTHVLPINSWWMVDLDDISNSIELFVDGSSPLNIQSREDQAKFTPLGRRNPLVIKDQLVKGDEVRFTIQLLNNEEVIAFHKLRDMQKVLLIQSPVINQQWFFVFGSDVTEQVMNVVDDYRIINFEAIEVDRPFLVPYQ